MYDLRDKTLCPSFGNLKTFEIQELARLLVKALEGQIEALRGVSHYDAALLEELNVFLEKTRKSYSKILQSQANTDA